MSQNSLDGIVRMAEDVCAREPIHIPGAIQPHGAMLILDPHDLTRLAVSINLLAAAPTAMEIHPSEWMPTMLLDACRALTQQAPSRSVWVQLPEIGSTEVHCFLAGETLGIEFEIDPSTLPGATEAALAINTRDTIRQLHAAKSLDELGQNFVSAVARSTGFERVLIYRFDDKGDGDVVAEHLSPDWNQSLLGFHFPASDVPAQVRALYLLSQERWLPLRDYTPVALVPNRHPVSNNAFDLTLSQYRSISPIHQMYQRNLGVDGSMAVSILHDGELWGLLVGHHRKPHRVPSAIRSHVVTLTEAYALRLATLHADSALNSLVGHTALSSLILRKLAGADNFVTAMTEGQVVAMDLFSNCSGVAVVYLDDLLGQKVRILGGAPPEEDILRLMTWLRAHRENVFATDCIAAIYPAFSVHKEVASGVLAVFLGEERDQAILWFRPEMVTSVVWSGKPGKSLDETGSLYLPRKSFDRWVEQKFGHSLPWQDWEMNVSRALGLTLNDVIIRQMRRIQELDADVQKLLWVTSHDLREPLRAVNVYTELLRRNYSASLDKQGLEYIGFAQKGALTMEKRLRGLLAYSEIGQNECPSGSVPLDRVLEEAQKDCRDELKAAKAEIHIQDRLPAVHGDMDSLRTLFDNLLNNAVKFRSQTPLEIRIWAESVGGHWQIAVADNGIGIDPAYHQLVFGLFQRLSNSETESSVGLGLTLCQRIVQRLGGQIWLNSEPGLGTTVTFTLPRPSEEVTAMPLSERQMLAPTVLRESTHKAHEKLETAAIMAPLSSGRVSEAEYRRALAALYGFYRPSEEVLFFKEPNMAAAMGIKPKLPSLLKDLAALGMSEDELTALPLCSSLPEAKTPAAQIGMLYVLEGATLGGQVVRKRIAHALGSRTSLATNFHGFHGDQAGPWWKLFQGELSRRLDAEPIALQQAVDTALATFSALDDWLKHGLEATGNPEDRIPAPSKPR